MAEASCPTYVGTNLARQKGTPRAAAAAAVVVVIVVVVLLNFRMRSLDFTPPPRPRDDDNLVPARDMIGDPSALAVLLPTPTGPLLSSWLG